MVRTRIFSRAGILLSAAIGIAVVLGGARGAEAAPPPEYHYVITAEHIVPIPERQFIAKRLSGAIVPNGTSWNIQVAINAIKVDAEGNDCHIQFGGGAEEAGLDIGSEYIAFYDGPDAYPPQTQWGVITLAGKITAEGSSVIQMDEYVSVISMADIASLNSDSRAFGIGSSGTLTISGGTVSSAGGSAILNGVNGKVTVNGGTVSTTGGVAIENRSTGSITVSGGTVSTTGGVAITNNSTGSIVVNGGTVSATNTTAPARNGKAITNNSYGSVIITGGTVSATSGEAIVNFASGSITPPPPPGATAYIDISGGIVSATTGTAVNNSNGTVVISGGTVSATTGRAVGCGNAGKIIISDDALVTSASASADAGTVWLQGGVTVIPTGQFFMYGGTVENTATGNAIHSAPVVGTSVGKITITGGKVLAKSGYAIYRTGTGDPIALGGDAVAFAYGTGVSDVISGNYTQGGFSVIVAWNQAAGNTEYEKLSTTDLFCTADYGVIGIMPGIAAWDVLSMPGGNQYGITIYGGESTRFIEIDGVTVTGSTSVRPNARVNNANAAQFARVSGHTLSLRFPERGRVEVYSLKGAKIRTFDLGQGAHTLRLNDLPCGTYAIRSTSGAWQQSSKMIVR